MKRATIAALLAPALALAACGSTSSGPAASPRGFDPANFVRGVTNPWFPLTPGTTYRYRGVKDGRPDVDVFSVTHRTRTIAGVTATVVTDRLYEAGRLFEDTVDWYGQDRQGNVWYLGEATRELDARGRVTSREGSWQAGVHGARPGIFMPARPRVGQAFRQEYYRGQAEDHFRVVRRNASVRVPGVSSRHALETREWTPLEPGVLDAKYYVRGIGTVYEATLRGGDERSELVSVTRR